MKYKNATFVSYYRFRSGLLAELLIRPAITIPKTSVFKGTFVPSSDIEALTGLISDIIGIVTDNQMSPITVVNEDITTQMGTFFGYGLTDTDENNLSAGLTIHMAIADSGENAGEGVLLLTYDFNKNKSYVEILLED